MALVGSEDLVTRSPSPTLDQLTRLESVCKTFGNGVVALTGVDLEIRRGEFLSLLGPSGCGKSTILRLLAGLTSPTAGWINWSVSNHELGFVFQEPTLMPWATVWKNVDLPLRLRGVPVDDAQQRVREAIGLVGLDVLAVTLVPPVENLRSNEDGGES